MRSRDRWPKTLDCQPGLRDRVVFGSENYAVEIALKTTPRTLPRHFLKGVLSPHSNGSRLGQSPADSQHFSLPIVFDDAAVASGISVRSFLSYHGSSN